MNTRLQTLTLCAAAFLFTGCFYLNDRDRRGDDYTYCDRTGCYECDTFTCFEVAPAGDGMSCRTDFDCMEGCYCAKSALGGTCIEAGWCDTDEQCDPGFSCQVERGSCAPDVSCVTHDECASGYCGAGGTCAPGGSCGPDGECSGDDICDDRNMCVPAPSAPTCQEEVTCDTAAPTCAAGTTPAIVDGCYTGECLGNDECPDDNPCASNTQEECQADRIAGLCQVVYTGINCTSPSGAACDVGDSNCTCESFVYNSCVDL